MGMTDGPPSFRRRPESRNVAIGCVPCARHLLDSGLRRKDGAGVYKVSGFMEVAGLGGLYFHCNGRLGKSAIHSPMRPCNRLYKGMNTVGCPHPPFRRRPPYSPRANPQRMPPRLSGEGRNPEDAWHRERNLWQRLLDSGLRRKDGGDGFPERRGGARFSIETGGGTGSRNDGAGVCGVSVFMSGRGCGDSVFMATAVGGPSYAAALSPDLFGNAQASTCCFQAAPRMKKPAATRAIIGPEGRLK